MTEQLADAFRLPKPNAHGFFLLLRTAENDRNLMRAVALGGFDRHTRAVLPPFNEFLIAGCSVALAQAAQVQRLQNIRFSLRVWPGKHGNARVRLDERLFVIPEMAQAERRNLHSNMRGDVGGAAPKPPAGN